MDMDRDHFRTIAKASAGPLAGSQKKPSEESFRLAQDHQAYCLRRTQMLFACYRRDEAHDPEMYCAAVSAVLSEYDSAIVDYVTDPRTGLPSRQKFLPNVAEVREVLEDRARQIERDSGYQSRVAEQLRLRDEWKIQRSHEERERRKATAQAWLNGTKLGTAP